GWLSRVGAGGGVSAGMPPALAFLGILRSRFGSDCEFGGFAFSPTATYSFPSGPKWMAPPLWFVAPESGSRSRILTSLPGTATSPFAVKRLTWLCVVGVVVVW